MSLQFCGQVLNVTNLRIAVCDITLSVTPPKSLEGFGPKANSNECFDWLSYQLLVNYSIFMLC